MDPHLAVLTAAWLFGIAALGGAGMAAIRLGGADRPPSSFAMGHGLLASAGLTLLVYCCFTAGVAPLAKTAALVLVLAAAIGAYLNLRYHAHLARLPVQVMIGHALLAAIGFVLLLVAVFQARL
jgi:hypothetical protein